MGLVNLSFWKDFEIQSWNEQGEITKIEGMLTIAFCFIFPCSHMDTRKELYLIIKIPYMVNMSELDKYIQDGMININPLQYEKWLIEVPKLKQKITDLEFKVKELIKENKKQMGEINFLKSHLGKNDSEWIIKIDLAIRTNRIPNEPNEFGFPIDFDVTKVHYLHTSEKNFNWCHFKYFYTNNFPRGNRWSYDMPWSLFDFLCKKFQVNNKTKKEIKKLKIQKLEFKEKNDIIKHLEESNENIVDLEYLDVCIDFLWSRKGMKFSTHDFQRESKISSTSTVQDYLRMFKRCEIIDKRHKGWFIVNIK